MKNKVIASLVVLIVALITMQSTFAQDDLLFRKRIISSTWNSLYYGVAAVVIAQPESDAAKAALPVISAGVGALVPLLTNEKRPITVNELMLTNHGQTIGWVHGFSASMLIFGDSLFADNNNYKVAVGLGAATSIGLGILGKSLGKNKDWSEGQVALYRHYGWLGPMTASCIGFAFADDPRVFGGAILAGGLGGYFVADKVNNWNEFTRGEVRATQAMTVLTGALGYCVFMDISINDEIDLNREGWLLPAAGLVAGTAAGHFWLKDTNLTPRQGMTTIYAASGGALLGLGVAMLINSDEFTPWYAIPYATGMGAYAFAVESMRKKNSASAFHRNDNGNKWNFAFMPYNIMLNNKIENAGYMLNGKAVGMQPLFSASVTF